MGISLSVDDYYVIQTMSGQEEKARGLLTMKGLFSLNRIFIPKRKIYIRRAGKILLEIKKIFPGYIFIRGNISGKKFIEIKKTEKVIKILGYRNQPEPVPKQEMLIIANLISNGEEIGYSRAAFYENKKVKIIEGPLKGLEGLIRKINYRKKRLKIALNLFKQEKLVDFGFQYAEVI